MIQKSLNFPKNGSRKELDELTTLKKNIFSMARDYKQWQEQSHLINKKSKNRKIHKKISSAL